MKNRILKNWRTSLLGLVFLCIAIPMLILQKITMGEFLAFLPTIFGLIYVRDTIFKVNIRE